MEYILFESNTGFTRRYAEMLSAKTGLPAMPLAEAERELKKGTEVFFLGWVCAGKISGLKPAAKRFSVRGAAAVGASPLTSESIAELERNNKLAPSALPLFYLRGGVKPEALTSIKRRLLGMLANAMESAVPQNEENWETLDAMRMGGDFVSETYLAPVLAWFQEQE
ncbi:MAG: hypothetical protein Q4Q04_01300 [Methanocorpusculum sp.]|nr:hypothetical protein [Methanocorpusculum sp.]